MLELAADLRLLDEALDHVVAVGVLRAQHLECDLAVQVLVAALVDHADPAAGDLTEDLVTAVVLAPRRVLRGGAGRGTRPSSTSRRSRLEPAPCSRSIALEDALAFVRRALLERLERGRLPVRRRGSPSVPSTPSLPMVGFSRDLFRKKDRRRRAHSFSTAPAPPPCTSRRTTSISAQLELLARLGVLAVEDGRPPRPTSLAISRILPVVAVAQREQAMAQDRLLALLFRAPARGAAPRRRAGRALGPGAVEHLRARSPPWTRWRPGRCLLAGCRSLGARALALGHERDVADDAVQERAKAGRRGPGRRGPSDAVLLEAVEERPAAPRRRPRGRAASAASARRGKRGSPGRSAGRTRRGPARCPRRRGESRSSVWNRTTPAPSVRNSPSQAHGHPYPERRMISVHETSLDDHPCPVFRARGLEW